jgi:hypothetical protein
VTKFQVRYWFDSNSRDLTGEQVIQVIEAADVAEVAQQVEANLAKPTFTVTPSFGPAQKGGLVVVHSVNVWYVEVIPPEASRF